MLPKGSEITYEHDGEVKKITSPYKNPQGFFDYYSAIDLLVFTLIWAIFWLHSLVSIVKNPSTELLITVSMLTLIGMLVGHSLLQVMHVGTAEEWILKKSTLIYDSGTIPLEIAEKTTSNFLNPIFSKSLRVEFNAMDIDSLKLYEYRNRLTIDQGAERYDIGLSMTDIEREWLFKTLCEHYNLKK